MIPFEIEAKQLANTQDLMLMSHRERHSVVWLGPGNIVYKHAPKTLIDTEYHYLSSLSMSGYVPYPVTRLHLELISMPFIPHERVTNPTQFLSHLEPVLFALSGASCRHGDLTEFSVLVSGNKPVIIDFGEARCWADPVPDKRPEGDRHWLEVTMNGYVAAASVPHPLVELDL